MSAYTCHRHRPSRRGRHWAVSPMPPSIRYGPSPDRLGCDPTCTRSSIYMLSGIYMPSLPLTAISHPRSTSGIALPLPDPLIPMRKVPHLVAFSGPSFGSFRLVTCPFCVCRRVTCFGIDTIDARRDEWVFDHPRLGGVLRGSGGAYRRHRRCSRSWLPDRWSNPSALRPRCAAC